MKKMNSQLLLLALLVFAGYKCSEARAINDDNNIIEPDDRKRSPTLLARTRLGQDWIKFTKTPPVRISQNLGSPVEISCEVLGSPLPTVHWIVGSVPLSEIENVESNGIPEFSVSTIAKVRSVHVIDHMLSEARTYTCVGRSGSKIVYASTIVYPQPDLKDLIQVEEKPFTGLAKPRITYTERMHLDLEGSNIVLPCKVHARPSAEIYWFNSDGNLIQQTQRRKFLPSGDLLLSDLKWEDMGTYKCVARNTMGKDTAETFVYPVKKEK